MASLARLTLEHPWQVRFIELMPFAGATELQTAQLITAPEMQALIEGTLGPLEPLNGGALDGEARLYRLPGAQGDVGFIASVSAPFCSACRRSA